MKVAWAVAAGALVAVPILALPAEEPVQVEQQAATPAADAQPDKAGIRLVVDRGNGTKGTLRIGL
jgi:hypothetical protein